jgi:UDP:flavonoid glycosyltransferase YjiC (YdhE family)
LKEIACFISPHGFGHATRTIAVLEALQKQIPDLHPHIFTTVPKSLFSETLSRYTYHFVQTDIGLEQKSAMEIDVEKTVKNLDKFLPFSKSLIQEQATFCRTCSFVLCDIAPLGIDVARELNIPSILVENFTWDWIYEKNTDLSFYAQQLREKFNRATYRIQTEPLCQQKPHDLLCGPIFRNFREDKSTVRKTLDAASRKIIIITMGGIAQKLPAWKEMSKMSELFFVILGQQENKRIGDNILLQVTHTPRYHPDLINCADLVVCKAGYSTVAECFQSGVRIITVGRENFPESQILINFIQNNMSGIAINQNSFFCGSWLQKVNEVLELPQALPARENGADRVADFLAPLLTPTP